MIKGRLVATLCLGPRRMPPDRAQGRPKVTEKGRRDRVRSQFMRTQPGEMDRGDSTPLRRGPPGRTKVAGEVGNKSHLAGPGFLLSD